MLHLEVPKNYSRVLRTFDVDLETKGGKIVRKKTHWGSGAEHPRKHDPSGWCF